MFEELPLKQRLISESERLLQMYHHQQLSLTDIAEKYGCTRQYIQMIFKELGIDRRPRLLALRSKPRRHKNKHGFTEDDDQYIRLNYTIKNDAEIALYLNKPVKAVTYRRLVNLKCRKTARRNFTKVENRFIINNYKKLSDGAIARALNRSLVSVAHHRNRVLHRVKRATRKRVGGDNEFTLGNLASAVHERMTGFMNQSKFSDDINRVDPAHLYGQDLNVSKENAENI
ncbi:MAG: hypothetical protein GX409_04335 [candidate division Zixibacteria bacterium]|jgi:DNA-binding CsgD family transcriptional regulator|nr:hypothetical protein [candidate division Zixibacteria bacterium]